MYDSYDRIPENSRVFMESVFGKKDLRGFYQQCRELELENRDVLIEFQDDYPGVLKEDNLADILKAAKNKKEKAKKSSNDSSTVFSYRIGYPINGQ